MASISAGVSGAMVGCAWWYVECVDVGVAGGKCQEMGARCLGREVRCDVVHGRKEGILGWLDLMLDSRGCENV